MAGGKDYPEFGLRSGPATGGVWVKYLSCEPGPEQGPLAEKEEERNE
jgi:hypothetical protein